MNHFYYARYVLSHGAHRVISVSQVVTNTESINHLLKHITYLNGLIINIFFENWQGQKIIDSSEKVYESVYVLYNVKSAFAKS